MNFVRAEEQTDAGHTDGSASSSAVVILGARQAQRTGSPPRQSNILGIRKALKLKADGPASPASPKQRRGSPVYSSFRPRGSPTYEPAGAQQQARPAAVPTAAAAAATATGASSPAGHRTSSRSPRRSRSRSRRSGRKDDNRRQHHRRRRSRSRSNSSSRGRSRQRSSKYRHRRSSSRSRSNSSSKRRHRRSRSHSHSRLHSSRRHSRSRSRSSDGRGRPRRYTTEERQQAWREARANPAAEHVRRGKQGLGFGVGSSSRGDRPSAARSPAAAAAGRRGVPEQQQGSRGSRPAVQSLDAAALIPGYSQMSAAEQLKARLRLAMQRSEQQLQRPATGSAAAAAGAAAAGQEGWTRFVFDAHGELEEDKAATQALMDRELGQGGINFGLLVAPGEGGDAAAAAAFVMGTGRAAAARAGAARAAEAAHEDAIFGRPFGGAAAAAAAGSGRGRQGERPSAVEPDGLADTGGSRSLAESLGVSEGLLAAVPEGPVVQQSWRERALALKARKQQNL